MPIRVGHLVMTLDDGSSPPGFGYGSEGSLPGWPAPHFEADPGPRFAGPALHQFPVTSAGRVLIGYVADGLFDDIYNRIHVWPRVVELGSLVSEQVRELHVWNAWLGVTHTLSATDILDGSGMTLTPPSALPLTFLPLAAHTLELSIGVTGAPSVDATVVLTFTGLDGVTVRVTGKRVQAWPVMADWGNPVEETLAWLTDLQTAEDGSVDAEPKRAAPRRGWEFDIVEGRRERRIVENATYDGAAKVWALPVMPDVSLLPAALPAGSTSIAIDTVGLDYRDGGLAMLWQDALRYEVVEIDTVTDAALALVRPTGNAWPRGTRVYPCRTATLREAPQWRRKSDQVIVGRVAFDAAEPCDWPAIAPATTYRGYPVLDEPGDESDDPTLRTPRRVTVIDGDTGLVMHDDVTGIAWAEQSYAWKRWQRPERAAHRSLLYWLQGRAQRLWVPTFADDVELVDPVDDAATTITVANAGITVHLRQQPGRRHLRIALASGTLLHREVLASAVLDIARESLLLDAALGVSVTPGQVRLISWMTLSHGANDAVRLSHTTDSHGETRCRHGFSFAGSEEPAT